MAEKARVEKAESKPIIVRPFELLADLDDRLKRIFTVLSLARLKELSSQRCCITRSATRVSSGVAEPPLGMGSGDRCGDSEGDSGPSRQAMLSA
jgi:hypothetical protein